MVNRLARRYPTWSATGADEVRELVALLYRAPLPPEVLGISDMDMLERHFPEYGYSSGNSTRLLARVPSRFIYSSSQGPVYSHSDHLLLRTSRYMPYRYIRPYLDLTIVGNTVMFLTEANGSVKAEAVTSAEVARTMTGVFERLWEQAGSNSRGK
jgi:hypothetical protein